MAGATGELQSAGATWEVIEAPGAFELPAVLRFASLSGAFDGYMALGCVIRGETNHFDYICAESARALSDLAIRLQLAVGYGILTTDTRDQAWERAAVDRRNKGRDTALACLRMVEIRRRFTAQS
ncbi:uncharacterized protein METZ01_LOCUS372980 [marine metagenome]|uniref:6,7-dimethyl-8-ribityllumazine synthase n=1 Tax=marine metagenome TaxID=408172 RepID=A0A382TDK4_9ZZZZ